MLDSLKRHCNEIGFDKRPTHNQPADFFQTYRHRLVDPNKETFSNNKFCCKGLKVPVFQQLKSLSFDREVAGSNPDRTGEPQKSKSIAEMADS